MAKAVYAIISHTNPDQVVRLVHTLKSGSPRAVVVVHHDQSKSFLDPRRFDRLRDVYFAPVEPRTAWGDFSLVRLTLKLMAWAVDTVDFDWLILLSGQDYPIQPLQRIERWLREGPYDGYIAGVPILETMPCGPVECPVAQHPPGPCEDCLTRYYCRYYALPPVHGVGRFAGTAGSAWRLDRWLNRWQSYVRVRPSFSSGLGARVGFRVRRAPFGPAFKCYKGSQWFSLNRRSVLDVLDFVRLNPGYVRYYQRTLIPDESFFHTILLNNQRLKLDGHNMRFVSWPNAWSPHPDVLVTVDLKRILASGDHFARRFDVNVDAAVLDRLDEMIFRRALEVATSPG